MRRSDRKPSAPDTTSPPLPPTRSGRPPGRPTADDVLATRPAWAAVDLDAIAHNVRALRRRVHPALLCAVVKADGYGHGAVEVSRAALAAGADALAVAIVAEGVELREAGIEAPVLMLSEAPPGAVEALVEHRLEATVYSCDAIAELAAVAATAARDAGSRSVAPLPVHLKIDTGMHRVGAAPTDAVALAQAIDQAGGLRLASVWTHCAVADEPDDPFTAEQLARFDEVVAELARAGVEPPLRHAANSAAALAHPTGRYDLVRCGIAVYGIAPSPALASAAEEAQLRPVMSLRATVSHTKRVAAGERLSYGRTYRCETDTVIATVPIGYADGVRRRLSAVGGEVLIGGRRRPIAGTVTMDQILVDCGAGASVQAGEEVVLLGAQGDERIVAEEWAARLDTIGYEIVCGIGARVPRRYVGADTEREDRP